MKKILWFAVLAAAAVAGVLLCIGGRDESVLVIRDAQGKPIWELRETRIPLERFNSRTALARSFGRPLAQPHADGNHAFASRATRPPLQ